MGKLHPLAGTRDYRARDAWCEDVVKQSSQVVQQKLERWQAEDRERCYNLAFEAFLDERSLETVLQDAGESAEFDTQVTSLKDKLTIVQKAYNDFKNGHRKTNKLPPEVSADRDLNRYLWYGFPKRCWLPKKLAADWQSEMYPKKRTVASREAWKNQTQQSHEILLEAGQHELAKKLMGNFVHDLRLIDSAGLIQDQVITNVPKWKCGRKPAPGNPSGAATTAKAPAAAMTPESSGERKTLDESERDKAFQELKRAVRKAYLAFLLAESKNE